MAKKPVAGDRASADPDAVQTLPELAKALDLLRGGRSYASLSKAANSSLSPATISDLLRAKSIPTLETLVKYLGACGLEDVEQTPWPASRERVATAHLRRLPGAVRVRNAQPRILGVHASIQVEGVDGELPMYVPRDLDLDLRAAIMAAASDGGMVLLVGGSSVGKTRAVFEAVRSVLPDWWIVRPDHTDPGALRALAATPSPRTVIWLDEAQRYLATPSRLGASTVRGMIAGGASWLPRCGRMNITPVRLRRSPAKLTRSQTTVKS